MRTLWLQLWPFYLLTLCSLSQHFSNCLTTWKTAILPQSDIQKSLNALRRVALQNTANSTDCYADSGFLMKGERF